VPTWQPAYFPEVTFPVHNRGTDECVLTRITFEVLSTHELELEVEPTTQRTEDRRRDLCYAIFVDLDDPKKQQSFPISFCIPSGETLDVLVAVGAKRSVRVKFVLNFEYDRRGKTRSAEVELEIINGGKFERCYQPGIALECFHFLAAKSPSDLRKPSDMPPTEMMRSLYFQNRPLNVDFLRMGGPGMAYFFPADASPLLLTSSGPPVRLEYSAAPTFYIAVGPAYAVRQLTKADALNLAHDPRLAPPMAGDNPPPPLYGANDYGACSFANAPEGFAITQVLPGCGLTGINTEIFTEKSAARFIGAIQREGLSLIPWGEIHQLAIDTVNRYIEVLKEFCDLHGPIFVRAGLVNVEGLTLAHVSDDGAFKGQVVARGPLREEHYVVPQFLEHPDPYENGLHIVALWSEIIAADATAGRMPRLLGRP
jgi:hypothetical protein